MITIVHNGSPHITALKLEVDSIGLEVVTVPIDRLDCEILKDENSRVVLLLSGEWNRLIECIHPRAGFGFTVVLLPPDVNREVEAACHRAGASFVSRWDSEDPSKAAKTIRNAVKRVEAYARDQRDGKLETYTWDP